MNKFIDAFERDDIAQCEMLIKMGFHLESLTENGETLLYYMMQKGNNHLFNLLLMADAPLTKDGLSLLMHAIIEEEEELVVKLLEMGVSIDYCTKEGETALMIATIMSNARIVKILLEAGSCLELKNNSGQTALDIAIAEKEVAIINLLKQ